MAKPPSGATAAKQAAFYGIEKIRRHVLLCAGPNCADPAAGEAAWDYLKRRIRELGLDRPPYSVYRTKCHCLRICVEGPILVVYPDGTWYRQAGSEVIERVLQEHVMKGRVVEEFVFAARPLPAPEAPADGGPANG